MTDVRPVHPFTMLPGAGPACEGDDCLPAPGALQQADPTSAGS
jgi:hypothetical protein